MKYDSPDYHEKVLRHKVETFARRGKWQEPRNYGGQKLSIVEVDRKCDCGKNWQSPPVIDIKY